MWNAEAEGSWVQGQLRVHSKLLSQNKKQKKTKNQKSKTKEIIKKKRKFRDYW
jgi:hypothetical protein